MIDDGRGDRPVRLGLSALSRPIRAQVSPPRAVFPAQGVVAQSPEKRTIYHAPADLMMRHWVGEAAPELDHQRADAACGGATSSSKYLTICAYWLAPSFASHPTLRGDALGLLGSGRLRKRPRKRLSSACFVAPN